LQAAASRPDCEFDRAEAALERAVKRMCLKLKLPAELAECLQTIKATMYRATGYQGFTVLQMLYELERVKSLSDFVPEFFKNVPEVFENEIRDFLLRNCKTPSRKARQIARSAWKENLAADRRVRARERLDNANKILSAHRGRPDVYDPYVVWAFVDSILEVAGCKKFSVGRHGDKTIADEQMAGPMLAVLVAAVRWAMTIAWMSAAAPTHAPPLVKTDGILTLIKRG
jgi:hypothetical protein